MQDVRLEYPEDVDMVFRHGRLVNISILDAGWAKLAAGGWPTKGKALPINITIEQHLDDNITVTVWATKN